MIENESNLGKKELIALNMLQFKKLVIVLAGLVVVLGVPLLLGVFDDDRFFRMFMILLVIIMPLMMLLGFVSNIRKLIKSDRRIQDTIRVHYLFDEDTMEIETKQGLTESRDKFPYANLHKVSATRDYIFLFRNSITANIVAKNGFSQGNADQLIELLRNKGVKIEKKL